MYALQLLQYFGHKIVIKSRKNKRKNQLSKKISALNNGNKAKSTELYKSHSDQTIKKRDNQMKSQ